VLTAPNLRGDDVAELQSLLGRLGFDCGRVDGIFGPATVRAVEDFQRNSGLHVDGICGNTTIRALLLLSRQTGSGPGVATVRELEALTTGARALHDLRVVVGQFGGLSALTRQVTHGLRHRGAIVTSTDEPDASAQASVANRYAATIYVGFEASAEASSTIWYYAVPSFESVGGRSLAQHLARVFDDRLPDLPVRVAGVRLPVLRETRMPAIVCTLGPIQSVIDAIPTIATSVVDGLAGWAASPLGPETPTRPG
jgi:N-acetylmuramoyl-L-alanine amidase